MRLTGENPSTFSAGYLSTTSSGIRIQRMTRHHPVTDITWEEAEAALARWGLRLPTEVQW